MCKTCNTLRINNDIDGIIAFMDKDDVAPACVKACDVYLGSIDLTDQWEACQLAVARELGQPEPVLYDDEPISTYDDGDTEAHLNAILTLEDRMNKGLAIIDTYKTKKDAWFQAYPWFWKLYVAWRADTDPNYKVNDRYAHKLTPVVRKRFLNDPRNQGYIAHFNYEAKLWNHWHFLNGEKNKVAKANPRVWPAYYRLKGSELTLWNTYDQEDETQFTESVKIKKNGEAEIDCKVCTDNRMLTTDEAYAVGHKEEQQELFVYNS